MSSPPLRRPALEPFAALRARDYVAELERRERAARLLGAAVAVTAVVTGVGCYLLSA